MRLLVKGFGVEPLDIEVANEEEAVNKFFDISGEYLEGRSSNEIYQVIVDDDGSMINISHNGTLTPMEEYCKKWISRDCEFAQEIIKLGYTGPFRGDSTTESEKMKEGEMRVSGRNRMMQMARQNGCGFVANSPAELKQGLALMKRQLQDMEAHRDQYELALQSGIVVAGFGGNLDGIEVPETLMTGQVPPGMTPSQAFDEVVDYMRKTIEALSTKLGDSSVKSTSLPRRASRYLESKKSKKSALKEKWRGADITYEWELREQFKDLIEHVYFQSKGKMGKSEIEQSFKDAMDDILEKDPSYFHFYDDEDPSGWYFVFGTGNYSVYARDDDEYKVEWSDGVHTMEPILCGSAKEAKQTIKELQDAEK